LHSGKQERAEASHGRASITRQRTPSKHTPSHTHRALVGLLSRPRVFAWPRCPTGISYRDIEPTGISYRDIEPTGISYRDIEPTWISYRDIEPTGISYRDIEPTGISYHQPGRSPRGTAASRNRATSPTARTHTDEESERVGRCIRRQPYTKRRVSRKGGAHPHSQLLPQQTRGQEYLVNPGRGPGKYVSKFFSPKSFPWIFLPEKPF